MYNSSILFFSALSFFFVFAFASNAQDQFPEFLIQSDTALTYDSVSTDNDIQITLKRPLMRDIIYLQEQINLLKGLVERQAEIQKIATNYNDAGVPYNQPAPPISVCQKLPPNILCLFFYPNLDNNKEFLIETRQRIKNKNEQAFLESLQNYDLGDAAENESVQTSVEPVSETKYAWTDIECKLEKCSALIVSTEDQTSRFRMHTGGKITSDIEVTSITPYEVKISKSGKQVVLQPLSTLGEIIAEPFPSSDVQTILHNNIIKQNAPSNKSLPPVSSNETGGISDDYNPITLGPTGLF